MLDNKASFGDVVGLRDGKLKKEQLNATLDNLPTFEQLLQSFGIPLNNETMGFNPYMDPNMTSEYGIAIYGPILTKGVSFFEVDRKYDLIQKKAKEAGCISGEVIPIELVSENLEDDVGFSK